MPAQRLSRSQHPAVRRAASPPAASRFLGPGGIALITVAAILTLRSLPSLAEYGWASIAFYLAGRRVLLHPAGLRRRRARHRLAARRRHVRLGQAGLRGRRPGFLAVWFDWIENVVWFPTVLSFVAATLAYIFDPSLATNKLYLVVVMLVVFWSLTLANFFGLKEILRFNNLALS